MIQINQRDPRPIYEQVKDSLRRLVISGAFAPDEKLPSVRDFATQLAINPNTVQRAYRDLEMEGFIYTVAGRGSFAAPLEEVQDIYINSLYKTFDKNVEELLALGESPAQLSERIQKLHGKETQQS